MTHARIHCIIACLLLSSIACSTEAHDSEPLDDDMAWNYENRKVVDYKSLIEEIDQANARDAKVLILCEREICPYSKEMTGSLKKVLKANYEFDSVLLRIEEWVLVYIGLIGGFVKRFLKWKNTHRSS